MKKLSLVFIVLVSFSILLRGASPGKIRGIIQDNSGLPLIGVNVLLEDTYIGGITDNDGNYIILNVPPGSYTLIVSMIGYETKKIVNVKVSGALSTILDVTLNQTVLEFGQEIIVMAEAPIIQKDLTSTEANISADQLEILPVTNIDEVLNLQAGMVDGHMRGGRSSEVSYLIDGIPITDVFAGNPSMLVENNIVQEIKVVSGTFNAEYGQAQSGIVDISTKDGSRKVTLKVSTLFGDYTSSHSSIFSNINEIAPFARIENTLFLSGPLLKGSTFILSLQRTADDGFLYGRNFFNPSVPSDSIAFGDNQSISMNDNKRTSLFSKITFNPSSADKYFVSILHQNKESSKYDHMFKWNPFGNSRYYESSQIIITNWNHMFTKNAFCNIKTSWINKSYNRYVFEDSTDSRYSTDDRLRQTPSLSFYTGGTDMAWFTRGTDIYIFKGDFTCQLNSIHQIKFGGGSKFYSLRLDDIKLKKNAETNYTIENPPPNTADNQHYVGIPFDFAAFIQSKSEYNNFILNLGIRLDYFDSNGEVIEDLSRPKTSLTRKAKPDIQISPRIGMAYPITDKGVMHVSYGHFFQVPSFEYLYANPSRTVNPEKGRATVLNYPFGNPELRSQKTVSFEVGLQQELSEGIGLDVTAYYKDIRNLLGTDLHTIAPGEDHSGIQYGRFINLDYGQVKGFTFALEKRPGTDGLGVNVDYTYQVVKGNASDPRTNLINNMKDPPVESAKQMIYLDWDQTHSLNTIISYCFSENFTTSIIGKIGAGQPYTPEAGEISTAISNSDRKPVKITFDCSGKYRIKFSRYEIEFYIKVFNLFDRLNEKLVYSDTGRATYTQALYRGGEVQGYNTKEEYYTRPDWFSPPRLILVGMGVGL